MSDLYFIRRLKEIDKEIAALKEKIATNEKEIKKMKLINLAIMIAEAESKAIAEKEIKNLKKK